MAWILVTWIFFFLSFVFFFLFFFFSSTLYFRGANSAKSCYAVGFLKYRVIIGKCANFDDATEAAILTVNFNPTSADSHRQTMHSIFLKTQAIV